MNRIYTLVIASTLVITGSNVFAQQVRRSPRPARHTEVIQYAIERASVVPSYRGYRKSNVYVAPKPARSVVQRSNPNANKRSSFALSPLSPRQTIKPAPMIPGSSRRITRNAVPTPATEIEVSAQDSIEPAQTQIDVVRTSGQPRPKSIDINEVVTLSSPVEQPKTTETAPVIPTSSRRISRIAVPTPATEIAISAPDPIELAEPQSDIVIANEQPQLKPVHIKEAITISSPVEQTKTTETAPLILSSSRRVTTNAVPTPTTEIVISYSRSNRTGRNTK